MLAAGHDEDKDKARIGTPMERLMMMVSCSLPRAGGACVTSVQSSNHRPPSCSQFLSGSCYINSRGRRRG